MSELTIGRHAILEALAKGRKVTGCLASPGGFHPAVAFIRKTKVKPADIDALCRADLMEREWEGLGNWTGVITDAGRAALSQAEGETK